MFRDRRLHIVVIVFLSSLLLHNVPVAKQLLRILHLRTYDTMLDFTNSRRLYDDEPVFEDIVIVDIDEKSINALGQFSTWPNLYFADIVDRLSADGALAIGFDIFFTETDSISAFGQERIGRYLREKGLEPGDTFAHLGSDDELARSFRDAGNVFLAMFDRKQGGEPCPLPPNLVAWDVPGAHFFKLNSPKPPIEKLSSAAYGVGFAHIEPDVSRTIHDYPLFFEYEDKLYTNFSLDICLALLGIDEIKIDNKLRLYSQGELIRNVPLASNKALFLKYYGHAFRFRYVSFSDILLERIPEGFFEDKIILVGSSAEGLSDLKPSAMDQSYPGVELHATLMKNLLHEEYIYWVPSWLNWLICLVLLVSIAIVIRKLKPQFSLIIFIAASALMFAVFLFSFDLFSLSMEYSVYMLTWLMGFPALLANESQNQYRERKRVRKVFEHYVSKPVIAQIMKVDNPLKVGGERRHAAILFCDIRGFSNMCEQLPAEEVSDFLHRYFNRLTKVITNNSGTLDKYIGDAILALYNVPIEYPDYKIKACLSALDMASQAILLREEYVDHPVLHDFEMGVGIASGEIIAGNFGSDEIFNYTGIGDRMNLASRLEGLNKFYKTNIIIDKVTYADVTDIFLCRHLDRVCVKGRDEAVDIYELIGKKGQCSKEDFNFAKLYEQALMLLIEGKFEASAAAFKECLEIRPNDYPSQIMLERRGQIEECTWDGTFRHDSK